MRTHSTNLLTSGLTRGAGSEQVARRAVDEDKPTAKFATSGEPPFFWAPLKGGGGGASAPPPLPPYDVGVAENL